jgi:hypothetical protein
MSSSTTTPEAIFIPIDLEASLGRIEEGEEENQQCMECEPVTRTSSSTPFASEQTFAPYPISETDDEIKERQKLAESVGAHWSSLSGPAMPALADDQQILSMDFEPSEALMLVPEDDDDFSLSAEEAGSLTDEDFQLERIQDRVSFWETAVSEATDGQPLQHLPTIPLSVSFSSHIEEMEW